MNRYLRTFSAGEISRGEFKKMLGGGAELWDERGRAQVRFLTDMGLSTSSKLLDIGCGPLRAGVHLIRYLQAGCYAGFDFNPSFVAAARVAVEQEQLRDKAPHILQVDDFQVAALFNNFDMGLAFSVLNHCDERHREAFFQNISAAFRPGATIFIRHARWFNPDYLGTSNLQLSRTITRDTGAWFDQAWPEQELKTVFPILELRVL